MTCVPFVATILISLKTIWLSLNWKEMRFWFVWLVMGRMMLSRRLIKRIMKICRDNQHRVDRRHRHFSFLCERANVVACGFAQTTKTHTKAERWFRFNSIHSEFDALRQVGRLDLHGCSLLSHQKPGKNGVLMGSDGAEVLGSSPNNVIIGVFSNWTRLKMCRISAIGRSILSRFRRIATSK